MNEAIKLEELGEQELRNVFRGCVVAHAEALAEVERYAQKMARICELLCAFHNADRPPDPLARNLRPRKRMISERALQRTIKRVASGEVMTLGEAAKRFGLSANTLNCVAYQPGLTAGGSAWEFVGKMGREKGGKGC